MIPIIILTGIIGIKVELCRYSYPNTTRYGDELVVLSTKSPI